MNLFMLLMPKPARIFKYEAFTARSIQNLKEQIIHFGSPQNFNDPYDCALFPSIKEITDQDIERLRLHYIDLLSNEPSGKLHFETSSVSDLRLLFLKTGQEVVDNAIQSFLTTKGVSCFSERNDSLLMWSHYGGHGKGFCLEFDTSCDPFQRLYKVLYKDEMPQIDIVPILNDKNFDIGDVVVSNLFCTKAYDWKYEQEWRCLHNEVGTSYHYPTEALTGVYFGPDIESSSLEIICLILNGQNEKIKKWSGTRSKSTFAVEFNEVTYIPHLEAKRKGML
jgi:hypothetical protein